MSTVTNVADFNKAITLGVDPLTVSGDIATNSVFDLAGKTITNLTIDFTGMVNGEKLTIKNGTITNLTVKNKAGVTLTIDNVQVVSKTNIN